MDPAASPTAPTGGIQVHPLGRERHDQLLDVDQWAFALDLEGVDPGPELEALEWDRTWGAWVPDGSGTVDLESPPAGVGAVYSLRLPVPGGEVAAAGLSWIGVHPQHRRRGVLTAMIRHHLSSVRDGGRECVSALFASEAPIYGRFGYGLGSRAVGLSVPARSALRDVPGDALTVRLEHADGDRHGELVASVFDRTRAGRPGMVSRDSAGLRLMPFWDPAKAREGAESLRIAVAEDAAGDPRGYALFRRKQDWTDGVANGTVRVRELVALDALAARTLWERLLNLDLMARVRTDPRAPDDALLHLLVDLRPAKPTVQDGLYVRLVDLPTALQSRSYLAPVDVVLDVGDALCPHNAGRWRLTGDPQGALCRRSDAPADLSLDVRDLASAWLGGVSMHSLHSAGLVCEHRAGALATASAAFSWPVAPYCGWGF